ncbi:hypothetical protein V8B97DRAFT_1924246 [Scleroderma yunnanense]
MQLSTRSLLATLLLGLVPCAYTQGDHVQLHLRHRVIHPNLPITTWSEFGSIAVPSLPSISPSGTPVTFVPSESLLDGLSEFAEHVDPTLDEAFYQVTVQRPGMTEAMWPVSIMKGCLMSMSTSSSITIHLSPLGEPLGLDYFVSSVPYNGLCPPSSETSKSYPVHNTTVLLKSSRSPPSPSLRAPPPLTPDGAPIPPVPEKSFLQKYWMYIAVVLVTLLISGAPEEPTNSRNAPNAAK